MNNGNKVRALRREAGLTQLNLAVRAGITPVTLYMIERGRNVPRLDTAHALAQVLSDSLGRKITLEELFNLN